MSQSRRTELIEKAHDSISGLITTLPGDHARIHDGYAFKAILDIGGLAQGASVVYFGMGELNRWPL